MLIGKRKHYYALDDNQLLSAIKNGEQEKIVLEVIYKRYAHLVMGTCMKYLKNVQDAEDITMNLFEKLPVKLKTHEIKNLNAWIYMVSKNECLMKLRKRGIKTSDSDVEMTNVDSEIYDEQKELDLQQLEFEIENLKPEQRECIKLFYLESMSYVEITNQLGIDIKKVKSAIQNGKRNLKIKLEGNA